MGDRERLHDVIIESDFLQVVQAIRSSISCFLFFTWESVQEYREMLARLSNKNVNFRFVKRSTNIVAHYLERHNCSVAYCIWRVKNVHYEFYHVMMDDLSS